MNWIRELKKHVSEDFLSLLIDRHLCEAFHKPGLAPRGELPRPRAQQGYSLPRHSGPVHPA